MFSFSMLGVRVVLMLEIFCIAVELITLPSSSAVSSSTSPGCSSFFEIKKKPGNY